MRGPVLRKRKEAARPPAHPLTAILAEEERRGGEWKKGRKEEKDV